MAQINKPSDYFNTVLYTGNGSTQSITGVGFQPDWVWLKGRSVAAGSNLSDSVRGVNKQLQTASTAAEETLTTCVTAFDSDGFSLGSNGNVNGNTNTYVSWNWLASGTASSNTDGDITSSVSANTTAGFSIVSWTNANDGNDTVGHGLNSAPEIVITKIRSTTSSWYTYTTVIDGSHDYLALNTTSAKADISKAAPTSSVFTTDMGGTSTAIAYVFHSIKGYSKIGKYTGNGSADGSFIYTGFKPAWLMIKRTDNTSNWLLYDNKREGYNQANDYLNPDNSNTEAGGDNYLDLLSNGFKTRVASQSINVSGASYIYMAFAEEPLVGTNNIPCTAR